MTPVLCCGAECGVVDAALHIASLTGTASIVTSSPISGARSIQVNPTASTGIARLAVSYGTGGHYIGRFTIRFTTLPSAACLFARGSLNSFSGVYFKQSDSSIYACAGGPATAFADLALGASGVPITTGVTYYVDVHVDSSANPRLVDVQVSGTPCGQATFATAAVTTPNQAEVGCFGATVTADGLFDDVVLSQTSADYPIGNGQVYHFVPTSDGTHNVAGANDFEFSGTGTDITNATTTANTLIGKVPLDSGTPTTYIRLIAPPNATDYVECIYGPAPGISTPTVAPRAVEVITVHSSLSTGTNNIRLAVNDNGTTDDVFNGNAATATTCVYARKHYATAPTGGAWTVAAGAGNFNDLRVRCLTNDAAPDPYFVCTMIEAEFAPPAAGRTTKNTRAFPLGMEIGMNWVNSAAI
jgi:hypothetical protein